MTFRSDRIIAQVSANFVIRCPEIYILDRFGMDVEIHENDSASFRVVVDDAVSHVFYAWVFGFGGRVKIKAPENVKVAYGKMVRDAVQALDSKT